MGKTRPKFPISISSLITAAIILTGTGYVMMSSWKGLSRTYIEDGWTLTQGKIMSPDAMLTGKKNIARKTEGLQQTINYEYTVNGRTLQSNQASKEAYVLMDNFPEGKEVEVYYNPNDVTDAVLVRSQLQKPYLYVIIGFCLLIIGVIIWSLVRDFRNG